MFKAETSRLAEWFAVDPGREADLRAGTAGHRPAEAVGDCTTRALIRTDERGAL
jgi:hypothetical protein